MQTVPEKSESALLEKRTVPLKWYLVFLIMGVILPFIIFAVIVTYKSSLDERAAAERRLLASSQILNDTLEQEFSGSIRTLQSLAASEYLEEGDFKKFYDEATRVRNTQPTWLNVILLSTDGRQLINTRRSLGESLPSPTEPESYQTVIETGQPTIGYITPGSRNVLAFPIRVPVIRNNQLRYILTAVITTDALNELVKQQSDNNFEWTRTVIDGRGFVAARTREPQRFVGVKAPETFLKQISQRTEGVYQDISLDNAKVYVGFVRSEATGWTTAVIVPTELIDAPGRRAIGLVIAFSTCFLLFSCFGAVILSRRVTREIAAAASAAQLLVQGQTLNIKTASRIREVKQLNEALKFSSQLLSQREDEREKHLAQSEAARAAAESANKLKDEFLITVSHELRTPLNSILGWISLLRTSGFDKEETARAYEIIERNARSQARLIEDLLDVSRIITGKLKLETQTVDLREAIQGAVDSIRHAAEAKELNIDFRINGAVQPVSGDSNRLQQVIWNLISNAVKFTPQGGNIIVELKQTAAEVEIIVADNGRGISTEFLPFVFERFRQADGSTKRSYAGLGLGLAIVKHLVELHGGSVKADSPGEGMGSTFTVILPVKKHSQNIESINTINDLSADKINPQKLTGIKVLIVDDDPDARELIQSILSQQGAEVRTSGSVSDALQEVKKWHPKIILSDIGMPDEDGFDFIRHLKELESSIGRKLPAAALTAYARQEDRTKVLSAGYLKHISKPIDSLHLVDVVISLVEDN